jgi:murein DD-endopeptidase MepM/ murein hydrolase activator NlpD
MFWVLVGVGAVVLASRRGDSVASSDSDRWPSLPVPFDSYCSACRRRRAEGLSEPGSPFGPRTSPVTGKPSFHAGQDVAVPVGTPLVAVDDGIVVEARTSETAGLLVRYDTGRGRVSCMHLDALAVRTGDRVTAGQLIGRTGQSGTNVRGAHLHIEWKPTGASAAADPLPMFPVQPREC